MSFTVLLYNITQVTFRQRITPPRLLGRMNASIRFCVWGVMPIAALAAGVLGTWIGVVPTLWIAAVLELFAGLFVIIGPFWGDARPARRRTPSPTTTRRRDAPAAPRSLTPGRANGETPRRNPLPRVRWAAYREA